MNVASAVSIYEHILAHLPPDGPGLTPGGELLPDEPDRESGFHIAPGLMDHVVDPGPVLENEQAAAGSFRKFEAAVTDPSSASAFGELIEALRANEETGFFDPFVRRVYQSGLPRDRVREVALRLIKRSVDRMPVKVGVCALGLCARRKDREILLTIGRHEEFSHYVGVALSNAMADPEDSIWELAKVVDGWGRVAFVEQLASTQRSEIKAWIVREGFTTSSHPTELAPIAATTGDLAGELIVDEIDDELYRSAGQILAALIRSRIYVGREDIDDYEKAPEAINLFLEHVARRREDLEAFEPVAVIVDYLELRRSPYTDPFESHWSAEGRAHAMDRVRARWSDEERSRVSTHARWILQRPAWRSLIVDGLASPDHWTFSLAERAARWLGDDTVPSMLARLREHPEDGHSWFEVSRLADEAQFDELLELARERVALHEPGDEEWAPRWTLGIHQEVGRFPGKGWQLFRAELESPILRDRRYGLGGLERIVEFPWPQDAEEIVATIALSDSDEEVRTRARNLLSDRSGAGRVTTP